MGFFIKSVEVPTSLNLPYIEQGDPLGVPVLLVHGFADSWRSFTRVLPLLPKSIRAFALTQRGHGDASRPATGYHFQDFAADLAMFMDALHLEAAAIVGDSMGGMVAQRFAIGHPDRILGLMLIGSPATLRDKPRVRELWDSTISLLTDPIDPVFVRDFVESTLARPVPPKFIETMVQESLKVPAFVWKKMFESFLEEDFSKELNAIKAPTLIIWGDQDTFTRSDKDTLTAAIAGSRLIVYPGAGHALCWEEPDHIATDLTDFIKDISHILEMPFRQTGTTNAEVGAIHRRIPPLT
jgi:pimeloyl-ACP methyl ester carboxylesterase